MRLAAKCYRTALTDAKMQRPHEVQELSINAYPASLMRTAYFEALGDALREYRLSGKVVIEISEKEPVPAEAGDIKAFKRRLEEYVGKMHVGFGIDDFGVGYSSIERLAILNPAYVKIDREVLHLETSEHAIKFVLDVTSHRRLRPAKVVIEGFDGSGKLTLDEVYKLGVHYIQGYAIGKATADLYRIRKEETLYLEGLLKAA